MRSNRELRTYLGREGAWLDLWVHEGDRPGPYGWAFDGPEDRVMERHRVTGRDMTAILDHDAVCDPAVAYMLYSDKKRLDGKRKLVLLLDEVWKALLRETFRSQIKDLLNPNGEPPKGGILIHCAGGMHRTGMIYGIIRRYVNDDPIDEIVADYKRHVDWKAEGAVGGYEELNVRFIKEFDLSLLDAQEIVFEEGMTQDEPISAAGGTRDEWRYA